MKKRHLEAIVATVLVALVALVVMVLFAGLSYFTQKSLEAFQDSQRVVVSLTTSPKRIHTIETAIKSVTDAQTRKPDVVYLNLPERFARTNESYTIPEFLTKYPLVRVNRVPEDEGPITKLSPAIRAETDPNTIIIIIDDDTEYRPTMIQDVLAEFEKTPSTVVAHVCRNDLLHKPLPYCELPEGWSGVGFKRSMFGTDFEEYLKTALKDGMCVKSDDLLIGNYMHKHGIPMRSLQIRPKELSFAKQPDALSIMDLDDKDRYTPCRKFMKTNNIYYGPPT
jgi:hypothetical protein